MLELVYLVLYASFFYFSAMHWFLLPSSVLSCVVIRHLIYCNAFVLWTSDKQYNFIIYMYKEICVGSQLFFTIPCTQHVLSDMMSILKMLSIRWKGEMLSSASLQSADDISGEVVSRSVASVQHLFTVDAWRDLLPKGNFLNPGGLGRGYIVSSTIFLQTLWFWGEFTKMMGPQRREFGTYEFTLVCPPVRSSVLPN